MIAVTHLVYRSSDLKHMTSLWWMILFFIGLFFIFRESVVCKKYTNANGKYSNYTSAINISIISSCGGGVSDACSFIAWIASRAGSFIAWIGSISSYSSLQDILFGVPQGSTCLHVVHCFFSIFINHQTLEKYYLVIKIKMDSSGRKTKGMLFVFFSSIFHQNCPPERLRKIEEIQCHESWLVLLLFQDKKRKENPKTFLLVYRK